MICIETSVIEAHPDHQKDSQGEVEDSPEDVGQPANHRERKGSFSL